MTIAIIDCGAGNLHSVQKAFAQAAKGSTEITTDPKILDSASHIVLPGVGTYADCMQGLLKHDGLRDALEENVLRKGKPMLGICVGMQMLLERGHEYKVTEGLGWFKGEVRKLMPVDNALRIPHMGWNELRLRTHPIFSGIEQGAHAYFVHSYHAVGMSDAEVLASVDYGGDIVACIGRDNIVATQFHPEKSQAVGLRMIENFVRM
jgi:imidazole glycerol-phosphate synthase subunit HisH